MTTGNGCESLVTAMEKDLPHLAQRVGEEGSSIPKVLADDLCQTGTTGMSVLEKRHAVDRAAMAVEKAFLLYHRTGLFSDGADYARARSAWAEMLMKWGDELEGSIA